MKSINKDGGIQITHFLWIRRYLGEKDEMNLETKNMKRL